MEITFKKFYIPAAELKQENVLPDIHNNAYIRASVSLTENVAKEDRRYIGKGMISTLLPYMNQDSYDRSRRTRGFDSVVLENEFLKATFVTELGGRLWSLYDKKNNRELLYANDVFQPANLALRNAWFSGGIEWNVGIKGHNPLTCSPMFAQKVYDKKGRPILKMYEYERIRGVVYSVCATMADDVLLVKTCIENTRNESVPMYWWSNIAVPETAGTRTIVPAKETFYCSYEDGGYVLDATALPNLEGKDITYAVNSPRSRDFFFKIPKEEEKWIAAVGEDGYGLLQFSDEALTGRKMFVWGQQNGGRHWNKWLSDRGDAYIEIQAGILKTQLEHFPMKARSEISFTEGYCAVRADAEKIHDKNYFVAQAEISKAATNKIKRLKEDFFDIEREDKIEYYGSGFGALENALRKTPISRRCVFPKESLGEEQREWLDLLGGKGLPDKDVGDCAKSYVVGKKWIDAINKTLSGNWYEYMHLGILYYAEKDYRKAAKYFKKSVETKENCWAYRNLAQIKGNIYGDFVGAYEDMLRAFNLNSEYSSLVTEVAYACMRAGKYDKWIDLYRLLNEELRASGRIKMLTGACYAKIGDTDNALRFINENLIVDDIKEGEYSLSAIWTDIYRRVIAKEKSVDFNAVSDAEVMEKYPLPFGLDYRMH